MDVRHWVQDLSQGMNTMKVFPDVNEDADLQQRMINGWKALEQSQIRQSRQAAGLFLFNNPHAIDNYTNYESPKHGQLYRKRKFFRRRKFWFYILIIWTLPFP